MKRLLAGALAALIFYQPTIVLAATEGQDGQRVAGPNQNASGAPVPVMVGGFEASDTTITALRLDADGNLKVVDADASRNYYKTVTLITNQLTASGAAMADSSQPAATYDLARMGLFIRGQFDSLSTVVRLAVQVRGHMTSAQDSASAFPWYRWAVAPGTSGAIFKTDSVGHGLAVTQVPLTPVQATSANSSNSGLLPGEFMVVFNYARDDTTGAGNGKPFSYPNGIYLPLNGVSGEWFWAPYTSVRIRVINGVRSRFKVQAYLSGTPL